MKINKEHLSKHGEVVEDKEQNGAIKAIAEYILYATSIIRDHNGALVEVHPDGEIIPRHPLAKKMVAEVEDLELITKEELIDHLGRHAKTKQAEEFVAATEEKLNKKLF